MGKKSSYSFSSSRAGRRSQLVGLRNFVPWAIGLVLVAFVTWIILGMMNADAEILVRTSYAAPEGVSLSEIAADDFGGQWAVAVDGKVTAASADTRVQPTASTVKMVLALAVREKHPFALGEAGETLIVTSEMVGYYNYYVANGGSNTAVELGEEISLYDALASVLIASSNNMADSLAVWAFGSMSEYREYATEMLARLGLNDTVIGADASGFSTDSVSTPGDLAVLAYRVLQDPVLAEIVGRSEYVVPVAGAVSNSNKLLGAAEIIGVKTGYAGDESGYCVVTGYIVDGHIVTVALLGAGEREASFAENLAVTLATQEKLVPEVLVAAGQEVGYFETWWAGKTPITATEDLNGVLWDGAEVAAELSMSEGASEGVLSVKVNDTSYEVASAGELPAEPNLWQRFLHVFSWKAE